MATKKDYILVAKALNRVYKDCVVEYEGVGELYDFSYLLREIVAELCVKFKKDNDKFDAIKFRRVVYKD